MFQLGLNSLHHAARVGSSEQILRCLLARKPDLGEEKEERVSLSPGE